MRRDKLIGSVQGNKTIGILKTRLQTLNKAVANLPALCDCETKYTPEQELVLAEKLASLWRRDFEQELRTGVRASMDDMGPSK